VNIKWLQWVSQVVCVNIQMHAFQKEALLVALESVLLVHMPTYVTIRVPPSVGPVLADARLSERSAFGCVGERAACARAITYVTIATTC